MKKVSSYVSRATAEAIGLNISNDTLKIIVLFVCPTCQISGKLMAIWYIVYLRLQ